MFYIKKKRQNAANEKVNKIVCVAKFRYGYFAFASGHAKSNSNKKKYETARLKIFSKENCISGVKSFRLQAIYCTLNEARVSTKLFR